MSVAIILALSLFGLAVAFYYSRSVSRVAVDMGVEDEETRGKLRKIHAAIAEGAMAFLKQEYKFMAIFMVLFAIVIALLIDLVSASIRRLLRGPAEADQHSVAARATA